jgi:hypothetical protein
MDTVTGQTKADHLRSGLYIENIELAVRDAGD